MENKDLPELIKQVSRTVKTLWRAKAKADQAYNNWHIILQLLIQLEKSKKEGR